MITQDQVVKELASVLLRFGIEQPESALAPNVDDRPALRIDFMVVDAVNRRKMVFFDLSGPGRIHHKDR